MTDDLPTARRVAFRLRGESDGLKINAVVRDGAQSIGRAASNDIVVPVTGVSRKHAIVSIVEGELIIEDAGSKNGLFVNGVRSQRAALRPGDWIQLGPAALVVEETAASDGVMAIVLDEKSHLARRLDQTPETGKWERPNPRHRERWMPLVNRLAGILLGEVEPNLPEVLADLGEGLGASGAVFLKWSDERSPLAVASWGSMFEVESRPRVPPELAEAALAAPSRFRIFSETLEAELPLTWAIAVQPAQPPHALILAGDFPHRLSAGSLLEVVLRMVLHAQPQHLHFPVAAEAAVGLPDLTYPGGYVPGRSRAILGVYEQLRMLVRGDLPVLITGETGVGKEHVARILHASSLRARGPFVAVNCAAIPSELLEAELFGIEDGVATGVRRRNGKFQHAVGGVIFLDEIGDTPLAVQAKLLRALQAGEIHPVGARLPQRTDVRVVAATNADLLSRVESGQFRRDLYYRVAGYTLHVPALRERRQDIPALVEHFMRRSVEEVGKRIQGITVHALRALQNAPWPGNIRELEHEVRRLVYLCPDGRAIDSGMLPSGVLLPVLEETAVDSGEGSDLRLATHIDRLERRLLVLALTRAKGNRTRAARILGLSRAGLLKKLDRAGLRS